MIDGREGAARRRPAGAVAHIVGFGERRRLGIVGVVDHAGDLGESLGDRRRETLPSGDQPVAGAASADEQRLKNSMRGNRLAERGDIACGVSAASISSVAISRMARPS